MSDAAKRALDSAVAAADARPKWSAKLQAQSIAVTGALHRKRVLTLTDSLATIAQNEMQAVAALAALAVCTAALRSSGMSNAQVAATITELLK